MMLPAMSWPSWMPATVSTGIIALLSACRNSTLPSATPLARAVEAASLNPAELDREQQDQQQAGPEARHGDAELGQDHGQIVAPAAVARRREDAQWDGGEGHEAARQDGQRQRDVQPGEDETRDRDVVLDRAAEITRERAAHPSQVLDRQRLVQAEGVAEPRDRVRTRLDPQDDQRGVAGQDADDDEDQDRNENEGGRHRGHPPQDVAAHSPLTPTLSPFGGEGAVEHPLPH